MSLEDRARQFEQQSEQRRRIAGLAAPGAGGGNDPTLQVIPLKASASMFPQTRFGIVDGEVVEIHAQDDLPGMSPVVWASSIVTGIYAPVPTSQCRHFATAGQAYQALQDQRASGTDQVREAYGKNRL